MLQLAIFKDVDEMKMYQSAAAAAAAAATIFERNGLWRMQE